MSNPLVILHTSQGDITIELNQEKAPVSCANFLSYVNEGAYDGTIFHRVIDGFMIQGGGFDPDMSQRSSNAPIKNEADNGLKNEIGTIAMARTSAPHSASNQFFINVGNNAFLNHTAPTTQGWGYAVFGAVIEGMDVVNKIKGCKTKHHGGHEDVPAEPIIIQKAVQAVAQA